jgi:hypothetical protein
VHRIRNHKGLRQRRRGPPVALRPKHAAVDQCTEQLFEEERISLCASEHRLSDRRREICGQQFPEEPLRVAPRQEIYFQHRSALRQPRAPAVWKIRSSRRHDHQRRLQIADDTLHQVEQWFLAPMEILEHDQQRLVPCQRSEEIDPRLLQALPGRQGMQISCNV